MNIFHICNQEALKTTRTNHVYDVINGKLIQDCNCELEVVSDFYWVCYEALNLLSTIVW